jgi:iron complex transport system ATP-binding protein
MRLEATHINYTAGNKKILNDISVSFATPGFYVLMGKNGAGKSSLLKILSGNSAATRGSVLLDGVDIGSVDPETLAKKRAILSQQYQVNFPITVREIVMMGRYPYFKFSPAKQDVLICEDCMQQMNVLQLAERNYLTLSGGEAQKVQMARVLVQLHDTTGAEKILFLDEPVSHLDISFQQEVLKVAKEWEQKNNGLVIAVLHDINLALGYADRIIFMKNGTITEDGYTPNAVNAAVLENYFDVQLQQVNTGSSSFFYFPAL